ncbi:MAG: pantoate--beta-alanine ligase [Bacteroidota bacterium]
MQKVTSIVSIRKAVQELRNRGGSIGFVPTMGALHEGHLSLVRKAKKENSTVIVTIFVNPSQFGPHEDYERYPRDIEKDSALVQDAGGDIIFAPDAQEMYPAGYSSFVTVEGVSSVLEGKFRPTHFKGVATIVVKLFNIVKPDVAYFGQKDAQQCALIKKLVHDLNIPVRIEIGATVREHDGLAMSSRNVYLNAEERSNAPVLYASLLQAAKSIEEGERSVKKIIAVMTDMVRAKGASQIDYIEIVDAGDLTAKESLQSGDTVLIPLAVRFGTTRLIDNIIVRVR